MFSLNINKKIIIAISLVSTIVLSVTAFSTFSIISLTIEERTKDQLVSESVIRGETIHEFFKLKIQQMKNLSQNQNLQKSINDINRIDDKSSFQIILEEKRPDLLNEILNFQSELDHPLDLKNLYVLGMDGRIYFSLNDNIDQNDLLPIYKSILGGKTSSITFVPSVISNQGNVFVAIPVYVSEDNLNSEPMGIIIAKLDLLDLENILRKSFQFVNSNESFLVNVDGNVILKSKIDDNPSSHTTLNSIPITTCFDERYNYYGKYFNSENIRVYGFSYCVQDLNFTLITEINESEILNPIIDLQQIFLFIGIVVLVGMGIASFFLSKSISQPILKLKDAADKITDGNFNARSNIKSGDEIEQLSNSFDVMASKIQHSLETIKQRDKVIEEQQDLLLEFSENKQNCCVGIIDIVNSTKIAANLSDEDISNFYSIFINFMASIIIEFQGVVIKNIGDALLFYFPEDNKKTINNILKMSWIVV